jgi:hypothetical protein
MLTLCASPVADDKRLKSPTGRTSRARWPAGRPQWRAPAGIEGLDRAAGYRYAVSIVQAEFSLTQVLDRPQTGHVFFEKIIRENLDIGRPDHVQLVFGRGINKTTPRPFRTRVITEGVTPSLHIDYKHSRIKQYHKDGRALETGWAQDTQTPGFLREAEELLAKPKPPSSK